MKPASKGPIAILACEAGKPFALKLVKYLEQRFGQEGENNGDGFLVPVKETHFGSTEIKTEILESVRGKDVYIVQDVENSVCGQWEEVPADRIDPQPSTNHVRVFRTYTIDENYRALTTLVDAARRCDAKHITVIVPAFPYARQHKALGRESITASVVARQLEDLGVKRVMTVDIHKPEIGGFFRRAILDNFMPGKRMMQCVQQLEWYQKERTTISSADQGGVSRANFFAQTMGVPVVTIYKQRDYSQPNVVEKADLLGNVQWVATTSTPAQEGRDVIIPEDMIDTGGTVVKACELLIVKGAKSVLPMCSLPLFNGKALQLMDDLYQKKIIRGVMGTNAVHHGEDFKNKYPWYLEVPIDDLIAEAVYRINHVMAITELLS